MASCHVSKEDSSPLRTNLQATPPTASYLPTPPDYTHPEPSFEFLSLPPIIRDSILEQALVRSEPIKPYYRCGSLKKGPWSIGSEDDFVTADNVRIGLFLVSKAISARAIPIFYGRNTFSFSEAAVSRDFVSRFGHLIRHLNVTMRSGFLYSGGKLTCTSNQVGEELYRELLQESIRRGPHTMEQPQECEWANLFEYMRKSSHGLLSLAITISSWRPLAETNLIITEHPWVQYQRSRCIKELTSLTVPYVQLTETGSRFMSRKERLMLELLMQQKK